MDNKQLSNAYAIAKVLGYEKSIDEFKEKYDQYCSEAINDLNSRPVKLAKTEATQNPFRNASF